MPPSVGKTKTNFKTYDAATRLLAAVIATNPGLKLDFAELAAHVGGGATKAAIDHRLRPTKQLAKMQATYVRMGKDPGELPADKGEIQKCFGESTPGGLEWQFRDIKALAKAQKAAVRNGESPAGLQISSTPSTTRVRASATTPSSRARGSATTTPANRKRKASASTPYIKDDDDDVIGESIALSDSDSDLVPITPSKPPTGKKARGPAKRDLFSNAPGGPIFGGIPTNESEFPFAPMTTAPPPGSTPLAADAVADSMAVRFIKEDPFVGASASMDGGSFGDDVDYMDGEV